MKALNRYIGLSSIVLVMLGACSPKVSNDRIDKLEARGGLLEKTTQLNKLRLEIERSIVKQTKLMEDVKEINRDASESADKAQKLSTRVSRNPGDAGLANRADRASRRAAKDAKKAKKLNSELEDVNDKIRDLRREIEKTEKELNELKAKGEFVPNN